MSDQTERFTLTQEEIMQRRALDAEFKAFMKESIEDRKGLRQELAGNTRTLDAVHIALFAKDDENELGITGLVPSMQRVVQHVTVTCSIAKFLKRLAVGVVGTLAALIPIGQALGWWHG